MRFTSAGILRGVGVGDHQADVVAGDPGGLQLERLRQRVDVLRHRLLVVAALRLGGVAEAAQVGRDHQVRLGELGDQRQPHVAGLGVAMQQDHRIALAGDQIVDRGAVDLGGAAVDRDRRPRPSPGQGTPARREIPARVPQDGMGDSVHGGSWLRGGLATRAYHEGKRRAELSDVSARYCGSAGKAILTLRPGSLSSSVGVAPCSSATARASHRLIVCYLDQPERKRPARGSTAIQ